MIFSPKVKEESFLEFWCATLDRHKIPTDSDGSIKIFPVSLSSSDWEDEDDQDYSDSTIALVYTLGALYIFDFLLLSFFLLYLFFRVAQHNKSIPVVAWIGSFSIFFFFYFYFYFYFIFFHFSVFNFFIIILLIWVITGVLLAVLCVFRIVFCFLWPVGGFGDNSLAEYVLFEIPTFLLFSIVILSISFFRKLSRTGYGPSIFPPLFFFFFVLIPFSLQNLLCERKQHKSDNCDCHSYFPCLVFVCCCCDCLFGGYSQG